MRLLRAIFNRRKPIPFEPFGRSRVGLSDFDAARNQRPLGSVKEIALRTAATAGGPTHRGKEPQ